MKLVILYYEGEVVSIIPTESARHIEAELQSEIANADEPDQWTLEVSEPDTLENARFQF